jgi:hypothetical protein
MINFLSHFIVFAFLVNNCWSFHFGRRGINWNGNNWAMSCDFHGNDLSNIRISPDLCGPKCTATQGCTHFTWTQWNGGTCWMKKGRVSISDAVSSNDGTMVCGVVDGNNNGGQVSR